MPQLIIEVTVDYETEVADGSGQIAADLAAEAARDSVETAGGGQVTANGVIIHGRQGE